MAKDIRQLIEECKALVEQSEPFQKKMKAKHSRMKKRVIGHGGQKNTPPFTEKPSMERSKSAPPIGESLTEIKYKKGSKFCLKSKKSGKNLGCYDSKKQRDKREKQIQYFKHIKENLLEEIVKEVIKELLK